MTGSGGSPLWLSHHPPDEYDRCVVVGGRHLCRRCVLLWPMTFVAFALALGGVRWPRSADDLLLVVLPLPAVVEFVFEHAGRWPYRPGVQALVTVPLAAALGVGFDRYVHHPGDVLFWAVTVVYSAVYALAAFSAKHRVPPA